MKDTLKNIAEEHSASSPIRSKETKVALSSAAWCLIWAISLTLSEIVISNQLIPENLFWPVALFPAVLTVWMFCQYYLFYVEWTSLREKFSPMAWSLDLDSACSF